MEEVMSRIVLLQQQAKTNLGKKYPEQNRFKRNYFKINDMNI